jgi:hypothetical protein
MTDKGDTMARKRIGTEPLTPAEKQARYRERKQALGLKRQETWSQLLTTGQKAIKAQWAEELKQEELKAARKAGRAGEQRKYYNRGRVHATLDICNFFISRDRPDIATALLDHFQITKAKVDETKLTSFEIGKTITLLK